MPGDVIGDRRAGHRQRPFFVCHPDAAALDHAFVPRGAGGAVDRVAGDGAAQDARRLRTGRNRPQAAGLDDASVAAGGRRRADAVLPLISALTTVSAPSACQTPPPSETPPRCSLSAGPWPPSASARLLLIVELATARSPVATHTAAPLRDAAVVSRAAVGADDIAGDALSRRLSGPSATQIPPASATPPRWPTAGGPRPAAGVAKVAGDRRVGDGHRPVRDPDADARTTPPFCRCRRPRSPYCRSPCCR